MQTETLKLPNATLDKVQGEIYTNINGVKVQVKTKFSLNDVYNEVNLFKRLVNNG